jgi:hypothetical protein
MTEPSASEEARRRSRIAYAAYVKAAGRDFSPNGELDDWLAAEKEHDARSGEAID